jgi:hypothetical protein
MSLKRSPLTNRQRHKEAFTILGEAQTSRPWTCCSPWPSFRAGGLVGLSVSGLDLERQLRAVWTERQLPAHARDLVRLAETITARERLDTAQLGRSNV